MNNISNKCVISFINRVLFKSITVFINILISLCLHIFSF